MQKECVAAEARMHAAAKAFEKGRKPLEAVVRVQREKLARRKVSAPRIFRCLFLSLARTEQQTAILRFERHKPFLALFFPLHNTLGRSSRCPFGVSCSGTVLPEGFMNLWHGDDIVNPVAWARLPAPLVLIATRRSAVAERQADNVPPLSPPRHQARCRALVTEMRGMFAECQEMSQQESALKAAARDTEVWESKARGEVAIGPEKGGDGDGSGSGSGGEVEWGEEEDDSEEARKRRNAGVSMLFALRRFVVLGFFRGVQ